MNVSALLFSYLIYAWYKPDHYSNGKYLFLLSLVFNLGSRALFILKNLIVNHESLASALNRPVGLYKICYLSASYQSFGFIKRGLIPSIVNLISSNDVVQIYAVQLIGFILFIIGLIKIYNGPKFNSLNKHTIVAILLLSPVGIYAYFNFNFGFYDMILIGLMLISVSMKNRNASLAIDICGYMIHEAYLFIRLPFLIFDLFMMIRKKQTVMPVVFSILINLIAFTFVILSPRPGFEELKANYFLHYPELKSVTTPGDLEAFYPLRKESNLSFDFGIIRQYFASAKAASYFFPFIASILSIGIVGYFTNTISRKQRMLDVVATLLTFIFPWFLCLVGGDYGRWLGFSYVMWAVYYFLFRPMLFSGAEMSFKYIYFVLLTALIFSPFGINYNFLFYKLFGN